MTSKRIATQTINHDDLYDFLRKQLDASDEWRRCSPAQIAAWMTVLVTISFPARNAGKVGGGDLLASRPTAAPIICHTCKGEVTGDPHTGCP